MTELPAAVNIHKDSKHRLRWVGFGVGDGGYHQFCLDWVYLTICVIIFVKALQLMIGNVNLAAWPASMGQV